MAKFANDTLIQVAGFDGQILAQEMVYNQKDFWNMTWSSTVNRVVTPINLTDVDISAQIIRRQLSDVVDTRYGLSFQIADYPTYVQTITTAAIVLVDTGENEFTGSSITGQLSVNDAIQFTGDGLAFGGVNFITTYYVTSVTNSDTFRISYTRGGPNITLTPGSGLMGVNIMGPSPIDLTITNRIDLQGKFTLVIDDDVWNVMADDPELNINATDPVGFSGRIKLSFPSVGSTPAYDEQIFLLFLIRSDGVVN